MANLRFYDSIARLGRLNYRAKIMLIAFLGTHVPLLAIIAFYVVKNSHNWEMVWSTLGVALVATLIGSGITLFVLNGLLEPVLMTSRALRAYRQSRTIVPLPTSYNDEVGTLMADAATTLGKLEASLVTLETVDTTTGLGNRRKFEQMLQKALASNPHTAVAVLRVDNVDRLAATYDQQRADGFMRLLATRLAAQLDPEAKLARVSSASFAILHRPMNAVPTMSSESPGLRTLMTSVGGLITLEGIDMLPDLRVGLAFAPDDGTDAEVLLGNAMAAAETANAPRAVAIHSVKAREAARQRFELEQDMRRALQADEFRLHFQPVIDRAAGRTIGAEALIRWQHPDRGLLAPGLFIPAAESSGMIDEIGAFVIREACQQISRWQIESVEPLKVAINLSARQFLDPSLTRRIKDALDDAHVTADRLEVELTETAAMADHDHTKRVFSQLTDLGVSIAIDDFGTGYASMSYLRKLPFDKLKIDREFVTNVDTLRESQAICSAMIALGQGLNLRVLAEGTERAEEIDYLMQAGCELYQGYFFSKPVPPSDMAKTLGQIRFKLAEMAVRDGRVALVA